MSRSFFVRVCMFTVSNAYSCLVPQQWYVLEVSFNIAGTLKQKVGAALPTSATPPQ